MSPPKLHGTRKLEVALRHRVDSSEQPHIDGGATEHLFHVVRVDAALLLDFLGKAAAAKERLPVCLELLPDENVIAMARPAVGVARQDVVADVALDAHVGKRDPPVLFPEQAARVTVVQRVAVRNSVFHTLYKKDFSGSHFKRGHQRLPPHLTPSHSQYPLLCRPKTEASNPPRKQP